MESGYIVDGIRILLGVILLVAGRNVFWLFIAAIGFLFGLEIAQLWLLDQPTWMTVVIAAIFGLGGALLAIVFQRLAFVLAGFFAGCMLIIVGAETLSLAQMPAALPFIAGILGAVLAALLTDWAIIVLSAAVGAAVIASTLALQPMSTSVIFLALTAIGVLTQRRLLTRQRNP